MVAFGLLNQCFVLPTVATQLSADCFGALSDGFRKLSGQVMIALHTFRIATIETED